MSFDLDRYNLNARVTIFPYIQATSGLANITQATQSGSGHKPFLTGRDCLDRKISRKEAEKGLLAAC